MLEYPDLSDTESFADWLVQTREGEHLECKEAANNFSTEELAKISAMIANCGGGLIVLGVGDEVPRRIVGTQAILQPERTITEVFRKTLVHIVLAELRIEDKRVLVFEVPCRAAGTLHAYDGAYFKRVGDSKVPMSPDEISAVVNEKGSQADFSAGVCLGLEIDGLDNGAIEHFIWLWAVKSGNMSLKRQDWQQVFRDVGLIEASGITYAALILFGIENAVKRHLPQAEVIVEVRDSEAAGPAGFRRNFQSGFFCWYQDMLERLLARIPVHHVQDGLFLRDIPAFGNDVIRESILNAICHRDYSIPASVFVRLYPARLEIQSPGSFPRTVTKANLLDVSVPGNRRIAEIFEKCGFVERAGQGVDKMVVASVRDGKRLPDYSRSSDAHVWLELYGDVDKRLLEVLDRIGQKEVEQFLPVDFLTLDSVYREELLPLGHERSVKKMLERGVVEYAGRGKSKRLILSRRVYRAMGREGVYSRKKGLDKDANKSLLIGHLNRKKGEGAPISELHEVLPHLERSDIRALLRELRKAKIVHLVGERKAARWFCS